MPPLTPLDALDASIELLRGVIDADVISRGDLDAPTPCHEFTVERLLEHLVDTHLLLLGATVAPPPAPAGGDLIERHATMLAAVLPTWTAHGLDAPITLGGNELSAEFGVGLHAFEAFVHAWDLAAALGRRFDPAPDLTTQIARRAAEIVPADPTRQSGPFGDAVVVPESAGPVERLIAHTGRNPSQPVSSTEVSS